MIMKNFKNTNSFFQDILGKVLISVIGVVITAIGGFFIINISSSNEFNVNLRDPDVYKFILALLNLAVLLFFYLFSKETPELEFKEDSHEIREKRKDTSKLLYWDKLNVEVNNNLVTVEDDDKEELVDSIKQAGHNEDRVNKLVRQLHNNIHRFVYCLIVVYILFLFDNRLLFSLFGRPVEEYDWFHISFKISEDIFNFLSAVFIFLVFRVLYDKTLDKKNKDNRYKNSPHFFIWIVILGYLAFALLVYKPHNFYDTTSINNISEIVQTVPQNNEAKATEAIDKIKKDYFNDSYDIERTGFLNDVKGKISGNTPQNQIIQIKNSIEDYRNKNKLNEILANLFQLFIGTVNGLFMALLFGRYISMEYAVKNLSHIKHKIAFTRATIYILPIYALTQPLFGSFEIDAFGNPKWFQNYVFFFCLIGKGFFLYFTWRFMHDRLLHYYLHLGLAKYGVPKDFYTCFDFTHHKLIDNQTENRELTEKTSEKENRQLLSAKMDSSAVEMPTNEQISDEEVLNLLADRKESAQEIARKIRQGNRKTK